MTLILTICLATDSTGSGELFRVAVSRLNSALPRGARRQGLKWRFLRRQRSTHCLSSRPNRRITWWLKQPSPWRTTRKSDSWWSPKWTRNAIVDLLTTRQNGQAKVLRAFCIAFTLATPGSRGSPTRTCPWPRIFNTLSRNC